MHQRNIDKGTDSPNCRMVEKNEKHLMGEFKKLAQSDAITM